ncbi:MAG TPA: hypothetical protein VLM11_03590, partial [Streptosporangiaceae bacterium]|nr:hypothetical protein [Streptosporangiaceae bacterium]
RCSPVRHSVLLAADPLEQNSAAGGACTRAHELGYQKRDHRAKIPAPFRRIGAGDSYPLSTRGRFRRRSGTYDATERRMQTGFASQTCAGTRLRQAGDDDLLWLDERDNA